jgi:hypothetical protein
MSTSTIEIPAAVICPNFRSVGNSQPMQTGIVVSEAGEIHCMHCSASLTSQGHGHRTIRKGDLA